MPAQPGRPTLRRALDILTRISQTPNTNVFADSSKRRDFLAHLGYEGNDITHYRPALNYLMGKQVLAIVVAGTGFALVPVSGRYERELAELQAALTDERKQLATLSSDLAAIAETLQGEPGPEEVAQAAARVREIIAAVQAAVAGR